MAAEQCPEQAPPETVAIVGAGSIGAAWAIVFAQAGFEVVLNDTDNRRLHAAEAEIGARLADLEAFGLIAEAPAAIAARVRLSPDLAAAVAAARHVQECVPEDLALKQSVLAAIDRAAGPEAVIASSSSFMPASRLAADLPGRGRVLVVHPGNPPYLLRVAEIVAAPFTAPEVVERTRRLMERMHMAPVVLGGEVDGFVFNRLQGALLREAYCLVRDGIATPAELDRLVRDGLGLRWSLLGPFETVHLNTRGGIEAHAARMGPHYRRMGNERGQDDPWTADTVARVAADVSVRRPLEQWTVAGAERDRALMALLACRLREPALAALTRDPAACAAQVD